MFQNINLHNAHADRLWVLSLIPLGDARISARTPQHGITPVLNVCSTVKLCEHGPLLDSSALGYGEKE